MHSLDPWVNLPQTLTGWQEHDISAAVPTNATMAVLKVWTSSTGGAGTAFQVRHPSSTVMDLETYVGTNSTIITGSNKQNEFYAPVFDQKIEINIQSTAANFTVEVIGYFTDKDFTAPIERVDLTPADTVAPINHPLQNGEWVDIDVSTLVSGNAKFAAIEWDVDNVAVGGYTAINYRAKGTTVSTAPTQHSTHGHVIVPLDDNKVFQWWGKALDRTSYPTARTDIFLVGEIKSGDRVSSELTDSVTTGVTPDVYKEYQVTGHGDATAVIVKVDPKTGHSISIRPVGHSEEHYIGVQSYGPSTFITQLGTDNKIEVKFGASSQTFYITGYITSGLEAAESATATDTLGQSLYTPVIEETATATDVSEEGQSEGSASLTLPEVSLSGDATTVINESDGAVDLPLFEIDSQHNPTGTIGSGILEYPSIVVSEGESAIGGSGTGEVSVPVHVVVGGIAATQDVGTLDEEMQPITVLGEGVDGEIATGSITLPVHELEGSTQIGSGDPDLALPVIEITGGYEIIDDPGSVLLDGTADLTHPGYEISAETAYENIATGELYYPQGYNPVLLGIGTTVANATAEVEIPVVVVLGAGVDGESGTSTITLPVHGVGAGSGGYFAVTGSGSIVTPMFLVDTTVKAFDEDISDRNKIFTETWSPILTEAGNFIYTEGDTVPTPLYEVMVSTMETNTHAVTEYQNYSFNSLTAHKATAFGANEGGIFKLDGADDAGTSIPIEVQKLSMGADSARIKRATDVYIYLRCDGSYSYSPISDGTLVPLASVVAKTGLSTQKANLPRGLKGRALGFKITNVDGSDIEIDEFEMVVEASARRDK